MNYAIFRSEPIYTLNDLAQIGSHNKREKKAYNSNPDIKLEKTKDNIELVPLESKYVKGFYEKTKEYRKEHEERMKTEREDRRKTFRQMLDKSKSVVADEMIFTTTPGFFDDKSKEDINKWANKCMEFVYEDLGYTKEQVLHATVHMDEKTPHIHCVVIPLVKKLDKRTNTERYTISKKQYIRDKNHLSELQDKYCDRLNKAGFELERGIKNSDTEHIAIKEFKKVTRSLDNQLEVRNQKLDNAINELEENMKSNKSVMFDKDLVKIKKETFDSMNKVIDESKKLNELKPKMKKVIENMEYYTSNYKKTYNENNRLNKEINGLNIKVEELETKQTALEQTLHTLRVLIREVMDFLVSVIEKGLLPQKEKEYCKKNFGDYMFYKPKQVYREKPQKDKDDNFCL